MSKKRLCGGAVVVAVLAAASMLARDREREAGASSRRHGQARLHHQVPGRLLLHPRRRREDVGQGDARSVSVIYASGKSGTDDAGEIAAIQNMVAQGVKGIAITPTSPAVSAALDKAIKAGRQGRADGQRHPDVEEARARSSRRTTSTAACSPASTSPTKLKAGDTLGILEGVPGEPGARRPRHRHARRASARSKSKIKVVSKLETDCDQTKGATAAQTMLTANPNLTAIYSACGPPALGAIQSIKNAGIKPGGIILVGFDASPDEVEGDQGRHRDRQRRAVPGEDRLARHRDALQRGAGQEGAEERRHRHRARHEGERRASSASSTPERPSDARAAGAAAPGAQPPIGAMTLDDRRRPSALLEPRAGAACRG